MPRHTYYNVGMATTQITLKDLAIEFGIDRSHCRKFVLSLGIEMFDVRLPGQRGTPLKALSAADADVARAERNRRGFQVAASRSNPDTAASAVVEPQGSFYIIALDPEARPGRLKFGYAQNVQGRLAEHRCAAPGAVLLGDWPAQRSWEPCIMAALSLGAEQVGAEVFDVQDVAVVLDKAKRFMGMLVVAA